MSNERSASSTSVLSDGEFRWISDFLHAQTGIFLGKGKQAMVVARLEKRLKHHGLSNYSEYFRMLESPKAGDEPRKVVDLLTTNETYFFREEKHFDFMRDKVIPQARASQLLRVWSAASSSGEEAYSLAMVLADKCGAKMPWEIVGTDISSRIVQTARRGLYPIDAVERIPLEWRKKYCLRGVEEYEGQFLIQRNLRDKIHFHHANLMESLTEFGMFDVIFLRNVMIYFTMDTKKALVPRLCERLKPGGYFIVSHSESLTGISAPLKLVSPSIYQRIGSEGS